MKSCSFAVCVICSNKTRTHSSNLFLTQRSSATKSSETTSSEDVGHYHGSHRPNPLFFALHLRITFVIIKRRRCFTSNYLKRSSKSVEPQQNTYTRPSQTHSQRWFPRVFDNFHTYNHRLQKNREISQVQKASKIDNNLSCLGWFWGVVVYGGQWGSRSTHPNPTRPGRQTSPTPIPHRFGRFSRIDVSHEFSPNSTSTIIETFRVATKHVQGTSPDLLPAFVLRNFDPFQHFDPCLRKISRKSQERKKRRKSTANAREYGVLRECFGASFVAERNTSRADTSRRTGIARLFDATGAAQTPREPGASSFSTPSSASPAPPPT